MSVKSLKKQMMAAVATTMVGAVALSSATYAWFVTNTQVTAEKVDVNAAAAYNLLIADELNGDYGSVMALDPNTATLTQVSTIGSRATQEIEMDDDTKSDAGDILFVTSNKWEGNMVTSWKTISKRSKATLPNDGGEKVMYYTDTAWLKAASAADIYLDVDGTGLSWTDFEASEPTLYTYESFLNGDAKTSDDTDEEKEYNVKVDQAIALLKTMRVGFKVTQTTDNGATEAADNFFVYAFAASGDHISTGVNTSTGDADGFTKAVGQTVPGTADAAVSEYTGLISNLYSGSIKVLTDNNMADGNDTSMGVKNNGDLFASVNPNEQVQVDIYVWMEGCDYDTISNNITSFAAANITGMQFGFCLAE